MTGAEGSTVFVGKIGKHEIGTGSCQVFPLQDVILI